MDQAHRAKISKPQLEATILRALHQVRGCDEAKSVSVICTEAKSGEWNLGTCDFGGQTTACIDELKKIIPALEERFTLSD